MHPAFRSKAWHLVLALASLVALALEPRSPAQATPAPPIVARCQQDLARRLQLPVREVRLARMRPVVFPDASLGLPFPGEGSAPVQTRGFGLVLAAGPQQYLYTASDSSFRYGGPMGSWSSSALAIRPSGAGANLNGDLVQTSLVGTNPRILLPQVNDFQPQADGSILARRRMSRSEQELLYLSPGPGRQEVALLSAADVLAPTLDPSATRWAAFVQPRPGGAWSLVRSSLKGPPEQAIHLELPEGSRPARLDWTEANPRVAVDRSGRTRYFEQVAGAGPAAWRELRPFPDPREQALQRGEGERVVVRSSPLGRDTLVLRAWPTGDEQVIATIHAFELHEAAFSANQAFLLLSGRRHRELRACTVDLETGEVMVLPRGSTGETRLLREPPPAWRSMEAWFKP